MPAALIPVAGTIAASVASSQINKALSDDGGGGQQTVGGASAPPDPGGSDGSGLLSSRRAVVDSVRGMNDFVPTVGSQGANSKGQISGAKDSLKYQDKFGSEIAYWNRWLNQSYKRTLAE